MGILTTALISMIIILGLACSFFILPESTQDKILDYVRGLDK